LICVLDYVVYVLYLHPL